MYRNILSDAKASSSTSSSNSATAKVNRNKTQLTPLAAAISAILTATAMPVMADEQVINSQELAKPVERIAVTGSMIKSINAEAPTAVTSISAEDLSLTGHINVMDALRDLPSISGGLTNESGQFNYANTGMNTVDLRNLGHERTLILINGRRVVSSDVGELLTDMNSIPTSLIERIDITSGGGSATYGSGAVAGVVNFILKDDFEGIELEVKRNQSGQGDNITEMARLTMGGNFDDDRGNAVFYVEKSTAEGLASRDRGVTGVRFDRDNNVLNPPILSTYAPTWRYDIGDVQTAWTNGQMSNWSIDEHGYRHADTRTLSNPIDRLILNLNTHYFIADDTRVFAEFSYAKTQTQNPSDLYWIGSRTSRGAPISIDNPYVPEEFYKIALAQGVESIDYRGRINEYGPTGFDAERIVTRYVVGIDGTIGDNWDWQVSYNYGEVTNNQVGKDIHQLAFKKATDVITDPTTGEIRCKDEAFVAIGCVPTNVFAPFTDEQIDFWSNTTTLNGQLEEEIIAANISNSQIYQLPAGAVGFAMGIEHRREYSAEQPDSVTASGMSGGIRIDGLEGQYEVDEIFAELQIPLFAQMDYVKLLSLNVSGRGSDYSHSGSNSSWQIGSRWEINDDITLRAQYAHAFRAPTIADMFNGNTRQPLSLDGVDPCHNITATDAGAGVSQTQAEACRAIPAIAQTIASVGIFDGDPQDDGVDRFSYFGASPDLQVETAETTTYGIIYTPQQFEGFALSVDYYQIEIDNIITGVDNRYKAERCLEGQQIFCRAVERNAQTGIIDTMHNFVFNLAGRQVEGIDLEATHRLSLDNYGDMKFKLIYNYVSKHQTQSQPEQPWIDELGELPYFKQRAHFNLQYALGDFSASWSTVYQGAIYDDKTADYYNNHISEHVLHNAQLQYQFGDDSQYLVYLGVDNLFDQDPPFLPEGYKHGQPQSATAAPSYSRIGRMWHFGTKVNF